MSFSISACSALALNILKPDPSNVTPDFKIGLKFASWLGLQEEGLMKHYGFDGSDHYRYARIF